MPPKPPLKPVPSAPTDDGASIALDDRMTFSGEISGVSCSFLLDTGSTINVLNKAVFDVLPNAALQRTATRARTVSQGDLPLLGRTRVPVQIAGRVHFVYFYVSEIIDVPCLLGLEFLQVVPCVIDLPHKRLMLIDENHVRSISAEKTSVGRAVLGRDISLPPAAECFVRGYAHHCDHSGPVLVEPCLDVPGVEVVRCLATVSDSSVPLLIRNVTTDHITLTKHSQVAELEVSYEEVGSDSEPRSGGTETDLESMVNLSGADLSVPQRQALFRVLEKHGSMFDGHIGHTTLVTHRIDTGDHPPIRQAPRRIPPHLKDEVREQLDQLVKDGVLEESDGSWSSPICMVRKKSGDLRICADMRKLNACTRLPAYPIPRIDDTLDALSGSSLYCVLDMNAAYHQVSIDPDDRDKATITTPLGNLRYKRMCFGLASAPFTCCKLLNIVLGDMPAHSCVHYFDDIIIHGSSFAEVLTSLDEALLRLRAAGLTLNLSKCQFFRRQVKFLGHVVSGQGMSADPDKVQRARDWPQPRTAKEVSSFLGLCSYFRKHVKDFATVAAPLFHLTGKGVVFQWSPEAEEAFVQLKRALTEAPLVAFPRFGDGGGVFTLDCDASDRGIGAVLLQEQDGVERVIAYGSHTLSKAQKNYSTTKQELLACVVFAQEFSHYLKGKEFKLRTDHSSLQWLYNFKNPTGMLARWLEILGNYHFQIVFRPGAQNAAADAMSRRPSPVADVACQTESCFRVSARDWPLSFIQGEQAKDEVLAELARLLTEGNCPPRHSVSGGVKPWLRHWSRLRLLDGVLFKVYRSRPRAPESLQVIIPRGLIAGVLTSLHAGPCGGHFGCEKLLKQVQSRFFWVGMCDDVDAFCKECDRCAGRNSPSPKPRAAMGELYSSEPWEMVSMDFLTDLPLTDRGNRHLLVVCDHFTRWVEVFPLKDMLATTVADTLASDVFARYGCPKYLHSDCAANFRSQVVAELCRIMGIRKTNTTAFHPQGNSRCERVNRTVLGMLSKYLTENHAEWDKHLPLLMLGYRSQIHKSLGFSPFFMMFGRAPRLPVDTEIDAPCSVRSRSAAAYIDELCESLRTVYREAIRVSDARHQLNKRLYERKLNSFNYNVGDRVLLFRGVAGRGEYHKFLRPWKPAVIIAKRGELNYRVRTDDGKMLCVHHNRLKPSTVPSPVVSSPEPVDGDADDPLVVGDHVTPVVGGPVPPLVGDPPVGSHPDVNVLPRVTPVTTPDESVQPCRLRFRPVPLPRGTASSEPPGPETPSLSERAVVADDDDGGSALVADSAAAAGSDRLALGADEQRNGSSQLRPPPPVAPRRSARQRRQPDWFGFS